MLAHHQPKLPVIRAPLAARRVFSHEVENEAQTIGDRSQSIDR